MVYDAYPNLNPAAYSNFLQVFSPDAILEILVLEPI